MPTLQNSKIISHNSFSPPSRKLQKAPLIKALTRLTDAALGRASNAASTAAIKVTRCRPSLSGEMRPTRWGAGYRLMPQYSSGAASAPSEQALSRTSRTARSCKLRDPTSLSQKSLWITLITFERGGETLSLCARCRGCRRPRRQSRCRCRCGRRWVS